MAKLVGSSLPVVEVRDLVSLLFSLEESFMVDDSLEYSTVSVF